MRELTRRRRTLASTMLAVLAAGWATSGPASAETFSVDEGPTMPVIPETVPGPGSMSEPTRDALKIKTDWQPPSIEDMALRLRTSLDVMGAAPDAIDQSSEDFLRSVEQLDIEPLDAWVRTIAAQVESLQKLVNQTQLDPVAVSASLDPSGPEYATIESLPPELRAGLRTWIGRELVRSRLFDEALPVFAEVDPSISPDATALLFYRGSCYHALLKTKEALSDLRQLLQHEDDLPARYSRMAAMMIADLKPLKEDSLDEISRLMTDVTRRLDLGRAGDETQQKEQEVIDKLTKLIEKLEEQQQQQQQQQQQSSSGGGGPSSGESSPMEDSRIAGANGQGDVDRKAIKDKDGWGNLPPAERQESLQQISRDLPTHYREAIEAYFRKVATQK